MKLFLILISFPLLTRAQELPKSGEVLSSHKFACIDPLEPDSLLYGLKDLCNSQNNIEIRLKESVMATTTIIVLSFSNDKWTIEKYYPYYKTKRKQVISVTPKKIILADNSNGLGSLFDSLVAHRIFLLPDLKEVAARERAKGNGLGAVTDGTLYTISYKVGNSFRRYWYGNPLYYAETNPTIPEPGEVNRIVELLNSLFYHYED